MANATVTPDAVAASALAGADAGGGAFIVSLDVSVTELELTAAVNQPVVYQPYDTWRPRFSPDMQVMLVCRTAPGDHDTDLSSMTLWAFPPGGWAGGEQSAKVKDVPATYGWDTYDHPEWAPDSQSIVIAVQASGNSSIVWLDAFDFDTLGVLHEVASPSVASDPSFLPNGDVVFVDYVGGTYYLAIIGNLATPNYTQLLSSSNPLADPMINPQGDVLVYSERVVGPDMAHPLGQWALKTVPLGGGDPTTVLDDGDAHQHPTWLSPRFVIFQTFRYGTDSEPHIARIRRDGTGHLVLGTGEYPSAQKV